MNTLKTIACFALILLLIPSAYSQTPLWQGKGRIALSSDGNEHDHDDWAATALALAMLSARGLQDNLVLYTYSDHVWGSNTESNKHGMNHYDHMKESALGGKEWFGFDNSNLMCAVDDPEAAYNAVAEEINKSSKKNPLFILAGGPMHVVGEGINRAMPENRKYVTLISHSNWNNRHADNPSNNEAPHEGWTFDEIKTAFEGKENGGLTCIKIMDQNSGKDYMGLNCPKENYDWVKTSDARNNELYKKGSWDWLYSRLEVGDKENGLNIDPSDAGMVLYLLTGIEKTNPTMVKEIIEHPVRQK